MASSAFPSVIAAVVTLVETALPTVRVTRGADISNESGDVVMVGKQDPDADGFDSAGSFQQTRRTFGGSRQEVGSVNCLIFAHGDGGDDAQDVACSTAFDYLAPIEAAVRADPTLGLTSFESVVADMSSGDVAESQDMNEGAITVLPFVITYEIYI